MSVLRESVELIRSSVQESKALPIGTTRDRKGGKFTKTDTGWVKVKAGKDSAYPHSSASTPKQHHAKALQGVADAIQFASSGSGWKAKDAIAASQVNAGKAGKGSEFYAKAIKDIESSLAFSDQGNKSNAADALASAQANLKFATNPKSYSKHIQRAAKPGK
jgi:hypothetical protein